MGWNRQRPLTQAQTAISGTIRYAYVGQVPSWRIVPDGTFHVPDPPPLRATQRAHGAPWNIGGSGNTLNCAGFNGAATFGSMTLT